MEKGYGWRNVTIVGYPAFRRVLETKTVDIRMKEGKNALQRDSLSRKSRT